MSMNDILNNGIDCIKKNSPTILTVAGIGCFVVGGFLTVGATVKAIDKIEDEKVKRLSSYPSDVITKEKEAELLHFTPADYVKTCWKVYSPAALAFFLGGLCVVNANRINVRRSMALTAAYTLSETTLRELKESTLKVVGEEKVKEIKEDIVKERISKAPEVVIPQPVNVNVNDGNMVLIHEAITNTRKYINVNDILRIENEINLILRNQDYCSLNIYLDKFGIEHNIISGDLGWNINHTGYLSIDQTPQIDTDGKPCIFIEPSDLPTYDYNKAWY